MNLKDIMKDVFNIKFNLGYYAFIIITGNIILKIVMES